VMERARIQHGEIENIAVIVDPDWKSDVSTSMTQRVARPTTSLQSVPAEDVTCEALHLVLRALHIDTAWHAGVMSAEAAMEGLHREIGKTINRCSESTRTGPLERAHGPQSRTKRIAGTLVIRRPVN
jgi:hypothetical protein